MSDDYPVDEHSDAELKKIARHARSFAKTVDGKLDICDLIRRSSIQTVFGIKELRYLVATDEEMGEDDGRSHYSPGVVTIKVRKSVDLEASMGLGRARHTLAHELAHAVLHEGVPKSRRAGVARQVRWIKPSKSAEHQAKVFAAALLIDDEHAARFQTGLEISINFGVSLASAEIYIKQRDQALARRSGSSSVRKIADEFILRNSSSKKEVEFLQEPCPCCGQWKLFPVASKFMCQNCDSIQDAFQDGDRIG